MVSRNAGRRFSLLLVVISLGFWGCSQGTPAAPGPGPSAGGSPGAGGASGVGGAGGDAGGAGHGGAAGNGGGAGVGGIGGVGGVGGSRSTSLAYVSNAHSDTISQFRIEPDGTLTPLTPSTVAAGEAPNYVTPHPSGEFAYAANYVSDDVSPLSPSG